ncbi:MAG: HepT-like ribonuclease domain-containing protein [Candidatus Shapirobacteria bacterium]|jgi:uncharacterized protein with HEPN domain
MPKSDQLFLEDIIEEVNFLLDQTAIVSEPDFSKNPVLQRAFCRSFEVIGEAVKQLSADFTNKHHQVEWSLMAKTRDKIIHHYSDIDYSLLYLTAKNDLPSIKLELDKIYELLPNKIV